ncbi:MAG TPA: hypothetical protein VFQ54_10610, partial [Thermomicrobiales bacterium]|nr:hypothetical protein [Thermomicrobiales bacterium]
MIDDLGMLRRYLRFRCPDLSIVGLLRTFPATILLTSIVVACGTITWGQTRNEFKPTLDRLGFDYRLLTRGEFQRVITENFVQSTPGIHFSMVVMVATSLVLCELLAGSRNTVITFFVCHWAAAIGTILVLRLLSGFGMDRASALLSIPDAGSSASVHGAYAVAAMMLPPRLATIAYGILLGITVVLLFQQ